MSDGPIDDGFSYSFYFTQPYNNYLHEIENDNQMLQWELIDLVIECMDGKYTEAEELLKPIIESVNKK